MFDIYPLLMPFGILGLLAAVIFTILFVWKLGIFTKSRIDDWRRYIPSLPLNTGSRRFMWISANKGPTNAASDYILFEHPLPMTKKIFQEFTALTRSTIPIECVLLTTNPPTMKVVDKKVVPVVTGIENVELETLPQHYDKLPKTVVATYHQHQRIAEMLDHDRTLFRTIDSLLQHKLHIIGAAGRYRIYCAPEGPVISHDRIGDD